MIRMKTLSAPVWVAKTKSIELFVTECVDKQVNRASTAAWYGPHNLTDLERCLAGCPLDSYRQIKQDFFLMQQTKQRQSLMIAPDSSAQICTVNLAQETTSNCHSSPEGDFSLHPKLTTTEVLQIISVSTRISRSFLPNLNNYYCWIY